MTAVSLRVLFSVLAIVTGAAVDHGNWRGQARGSEPRPDGPLQLLESIVSGGRGAGMIGPRSTVFGYRFDRVSAALDREAVESALVRFNLLSQEFRADDVAGVVVLRHLSVPQRVAKRLAVRHESGAVVSTAAAAVVQLAGELVGVRFGGVAGSGPTPDSACGAGRQVNLPAGSQTVVERLNAVVREVGGMA